MKLRYLMIVASMATCFAQGPGQPPPRGDAARTPNLDSLKTYLNLSDTQIQGLLQIQTQQQSAMQPIRDEMMAKQKALHDLLKAGSTDTAAIGSLQMELQALRQKAQEAAKGLTTQTTAILTPDQKTKLKVLEDAAKLQNEIRQATAAHLLTPPDNIGPAFMGRGMRGGPQGQPSQGPMFGRRPGGQ